MLKRFFTSPWFGAVGAVMSAVWEAFWLVGPPIGLGASDRNPFLGWGLLALMVCFSQSFFTLLRDNQGLKRRLMEIEESRPRIQLREPDAIFVETVLQNFGGIHAVVPFLKVQFINDPPRPYPSAKANDVRAYVRFYRCSDNALILTMDGRWAESDQPSAINALESKARLLATTFGLGEQHSLDIAYRDGENGKYYGWNNDNYRFMSFRCESHLLDGEKFRVEIHLRGDWVDERFSFSFRKENSTFKIEGRN